MIAAAPRHRWSRSGVVFLALCVGACGEGSPYLKPGEPYATRYVIPDDRLIAETPEDEAWIAYNLGLAVCSLEDETSAASFACERRARELLVRAWLDARGDPAHVNAYLDALTAVAEAGYLDEYVWMFLRRRGWERPEGLRRDAFRAWRRTHLPGHSPKTVRLGYWVE